MIEIRALLEERFTGRLEERRDDSKNDSRDLFVQMAQKNDSPNDPRDFLQTDTAKDRSNHPRRWCHGFES